MWRYSNKHFIYCTRKKGAAGRIFEFLLPETLKNCILNEKLNPFFFILSEFSFTDTDNSQDSREREGTIFYSTLPLPSAHEQSDIYLELSMSDDYHIFNHTTCIYQTATDEINHLIELLFDWLMWCWLLLVCLLIWHEKPVESNSKTIVLVLQENRLTIRAFSENQGTYFQFSRRGRKDIPKSSLLLRACSNEQV